MKLSHVLSILILAVLASQCKSTKDYSEVKEEFDRLNSPEVFNAKAYPLDKLKQDSFRAGQLRSKPWTDTYWPLNRAGMAFRWIDQSVGFDLKVDPSATDFAVQLKNKVSVAHSNARSFVGKNLEATVKLSPAEKADLAMGRNDFPLLKQELLQYVQNAQAFKDINWNWMGHCHGWAPVAYMLPAPKSGVIMKSPSGQEVFFTPGDIRGLYTKAASDYGFDGVDRFLGSRCNDNAANIPVDRMKRPIDASLGLMEPGKYFSVSVPVKIELNGWNGSDQLADQALGVVGRIGPRFSSSPRIWISAVEEIDRQKNIFSVRVYSTKKIDGQIYRDQIIFGLNPNEVGVFVDEQGQAIKENGVVKKDAAKASSVWQKVMANAPQQLKSGTFRLAFKYWKECRDTNPGSFHLVLASTLSVGGRRGKARSFVMDITRDDQVWNHPIYQFQSFIGEPTNLKEGKTTDPFKSWRAKNTSKIVDVYTVVGYGIENGPKIIYRPEDEALKFMLMRYTLELDDKGVVIGGEWHQTASNLSSVPQPLSGEALLKDLRKLSSAEDGTMNFAHPDFIWGPTEGAQLKDGAMLPRTFLTKLQSCSEMTATEKVTVQGVSVPAVRCSL